LVSKINPIQIAKVKHQRPSAEFREVWQYNNNMYTILSYLPTALLPSKIPFTRYVKEHIFEPLGMTSTTYSAQVANANGLLADGMARQLINTGGAPFIPRAVPYFLPDNEDGGSELFLSHLKFKPN
jgi:CubicO group peptidase (beta-lactamase class C family)